MLDDSGTKPLRPAPEPLRVDESFEPDDARRASYWVTLHGRSLVGLLAVSVAVVVSQELLGYRGPLWPLMGLALIGASIATVGTMTAAGYVSGGALRVSAWTGAALLAATLLGYVYLVLVGSTDLDLGAIPLHTLGLLYLGGLGSLALHARTVGALTGDSGPTRPALLTLVLAAMLGALIGAELLGVIPAWRPIGIACLAPLVTYLWATRRARAALVRFAATTRVSPPR